MDRQTTIPPALTPEEWRARTDGSEFALPHVFEDERGRRVRYYVDYGNTYGGYESLSGDGLPEMIALANAALPDGDPRKLTWDDVRMLEELASEPADGFTVPAEKIRNLASRVAALLPPASPPHPSSE